MSLASIQSILEVKRHPNADLLDICKVMGYECIVKKDQWKVGDLCVFIEPDSVLPDKPWASFYKAKSSRIRAIKLRQSWSFGVVESASNVGYTGPMEAGLDVTEAIGAIKYEAPIPQDLQASGPYGFGIPKTDQERYQSILDLPFGQKVDVTQKIDGQSFTALCKLPETLDGEIVEGVGGRSFLYKPDSINNYTQNQANHDVLNRLNLFCRKNRVSLAIRGEQYGAGIQKSSVNPHSKLNLGLAFFSTWLIDERRYACKGHPLYIFDLAPQLGLPTVPMLEQDVILTPELIKKYDEDLEQINGQSFEGVVISHAGGSFKVINKHFDSRK